MRIRRRFWYDFRCAGKGKNEQKCGRVCSKSISSLCKITSNSGPFWARFWELLGSILGGFWVQKRAKRGSESMTKKRRKRDRQKKFQNRTRPLSAPPPLPTPSRTLPQSSAQGRDLDKSGGEVEAGGWRAEVEAEAVGGIRTPDAVASQAQATARRIYEHSELMFMSSWSVE